MLRKETESGVIDLPGDEPEITKLLVQYLYEAEYNPVLPTDSQVRTSTAAPPQEAGYKYDFPHSCQNGTSPSDWFDDTCTEKVCPHHTCADHQPWANYCCQNFTCELCKAEDFLLHAKMYETGDKYEVVGLKDLAKDKFKASCKHFWRNPSFALAVRHAFSTTVEDDTGLRDIVSATTSEHLELVNDPEVGAILAEFNGSALGILRATFEKQEREKQEREKSGWK